MKKGMFTQRSQCFSAGFVHCCGFIFISNVDIWLIFCPHETYLLHHYNVMLFTVSTNYGQALQVVIYATGDKQR